MANRMMNTPVEAAKTAAWAAATGGQILREAGEDALHLVRPVPATPEGIAYQGLLKGYERRLVMINFPALDKDPIGNGDMDVEALLAADTMADHKLIDQDTPVDMRLIVPEELLDDATHKRRGARLLNVMGLAFEEEYNILTSDSSEEEQRIRPLDSFPIVPTERERSPTDATTVYDALAPQLDGLSLQFNNDPDYKPPVMVGIIGSTYERALFGGHGAVLGSSRGSNVLVLESAGDRVEDNVYMWLRAKNPRASLASERIRDKLEETEAKPTN